MLLRILSIALLVLAAAFAQPPGRGAGAPDWRPRLVGAEPGVQGPVVKGAPFSADLVSETTQTLADGNHIRQTSRSHLYRDAEGRTRREQSLDALGVLAPNTNLPPVVFINDPVAHVNYALRPSARTATRSAGRSFGRNGGPAQKKDDSAAGPGRRMRSPQAAPAGQNIKTEALGRQTIEGVPTEGTRTTISISAGQMGNEQAIQVVTEAWYSPDLQTVVLFKRSDPRSGETVTRYININRTEPAHTLFEVPADYKITDANGRGGTSPAK